ncbi:RNA-directed DNA polymerase, eukaryota, reverse transcriptase zinc-binding domain protein [Tanacetum coccineum]
MTSKQDDQTRYQQVSLALNDLDQKIDMDMDLVQKSRIKWDIEGDENSKFFHGLINKKRRQQMVRGVIINGMWNTDPYQVKNAFFQYYQDKFQAFESQIPLGYNSSCMKLNDDDRVALDKEASLDEIKNAIWDCGSSKAPGPDGFSFMFLKKYWDFMKDDVNDFVSSFMLTGRLPLGTNSAFITLIPKISNPILIKDYRPISLIGMQYKIIAKLLANRLASVIGKLISPEQSAFISGRQILDGPLMLSELIDWYKKKNKKLLILKVDFEKAFDSVTCLQSARTSVIVNGSPTLEFSIHRGLRQGDPLSPLLFILVMEGLHLALKDVVQTHKIKGTHVGTSGFNLSHLFYADDVVITTDWNSNDLSNIIQILNDFYKASGLKINISKSNIYGVGVSMEDLVIMARSIGCAAGSLPLIYLGLPIGTNMNNLSNWNTLVDKFKAKLSRWKANLLSIGGRLTLIKSVLGSLGIYYLSMFKVPESILKQLERIRANFFWGGDRDNKKMSWVRWDQILASKNNGGLGVRSLKAFNLALLQKWRWRLVTNPDLLWVSVVKAIYGEDAGYHKQQDAWIGDSPLYIRYNRLFHLDNNENCLISDRITDTWQWLLGKDGMFFVSDTRIHIDVITLPINNYDSLLSNLLPIKVNIFIWRLCLDRLPHRLNLSLRGLEIESLRCPSCNTGIESADHIFFTCSLAKEVWKLILRWVDFSAQQLNSFLDCRSWLGSFSGSKIKCDRLLVIIAATCKIYMIRAKELFMWSPIFKEPANTGYNSDKDADVGDHEINDNGSDYRNLKEESDIEAVSDTVFGDSIDNNTGEQEHSNLSATNEGSYDPFNIYDLLNKQQVEDNKSDNSISHPPGFTHVNVEDSKHRDRQEGSASSKSRTSEFCSRVVEEAQAVDDNPSPIPNAINNRRKTGGSILDLLDELIKVGNTMGYSLDGCAKDLENIIGLQGECDVPI